MVDLWLTSDWHLFHENLIKWQGRPFANAHEMNEMLITLHNERVKPQDHVYNLGDVTMLRGSGAHRVEPLLQRLNGHQRLILGNHDQCPVEWYRRFFEKIKAINVLDHIIFTHIPIHECSIGRFTANVHGHTHSNPSPMPSLQIDSATQQVRVIPYVNVCVEKTGYAPIHFDDVRQRIRLLAEGNCAPKDIENAVRHKRT